MHGSIVLPYGALSHEDEALFYKWSLEVKKNRRTIIDEKDRNKPGAVGAIEESLAVELGTFLGRSAAILSKHIDNVHTIDVFEDVQLIKAEASRVHYQEFFDMIPRSFDLVSKSLAGRFPNVTVIKGYSLNVAGSYEDQSIDLLMFDGDHTYYGLKDDFAHWFPKLKTGGYLIVHDSGPKAHWMEPILFVRTITKFMEKVDNSDISTVWRKK